MHEVEKLCSQVAIIYKGRLQAEGTPHGLLEEFDQPDLEELFFFLVDRADKASGRRPSSMVMAQAAERSRPQSRLIREIMTRPSCAGRTCW